MPIVQTKLTIHELKLCIPFTSHLKITVSATEEVKKLQAIVAYLFAYSLTYLLSYLLAKRVKVFK